MVSNKIEVNRMLNYCNFFVAFVLFNVGGYEVADGLFIDHTENSQFIQQRIGQNITLQCSLDGLVGNSKTAYVTYNWYFKQCGEGSSAALNCYDTDENEEWTCLFCPDNICKPELHLMNVTEKYSGLYKCTVMPKIGNILDVKLIRMYQLNVKNSSLKIPEFLDAYPINKTVSEGSLTVLQSRVYSEEYPTIKWFRRLYNSKNSSYEKLHTTVHKDGRIYELLTSTREISTSRNVYLSKLTIDDVQLRDEGFYACVAISFHGHIIREAYLKVYTPNNGNDLTEYWSDYSEEDVVLPTDPNEFLLLFLIPVCLALLPLSVWFCYIIFKRYRNFNLNDDVQEKIFQENVYDPVC